MHCWCLPCLLCVIVPVKFCCGQSWLNLLQFLLSYSIFFICCQGSCLSLTLKVTEMWLASTVLLETDLSTSSLKIRPWLCSKIFSHHPVFVSDMLGAHCTLFCYHCSITDRDVCPLKSVLNGKCDISSCEVNHTSSLLY